MSSETTLQTVRLGDLEHGAATEAGSGMNTGVNFPFSSAFTSTTGIELEGRRTVVDFDLDPGTEFETRTESPEEILGCLAGSAVEAWGPIEAGELTMVPPIAPQGLRNEGSEMARFLGFFSDRTTVTEFESPGELLGVAVLNT